MTRRLELEVTSALGDFLRSRAFAKVFDEYDARYFGNEVLVYRSPELSLKFVRDRGEVSVDVGPLDGSNWYMAPRLFEYLGIPAHDLYGPADAEMLRRHALILGESYDAITSLLSPENLPESERELREFWKKKAEEMFPRDDVGDYGPH
jgi:hypothetical protein